MLKLTLQCFGHLIRKADSLEKILMLRKIEGRRRNRVSEDEMAGWHYQSNEHELRQTPRDGEGQGGLACCSPWGRKESDKTGQLDNSNNDKMRPVSNFPTP